MVVPRGHPTTPYYNFDSEFAADRRIAKGKLNLAHSTPWWGGIVSTGKAGGITEGITFFSSADETSLRKGPRINKSDTNEYYPSISAFFGNRASQVGDTHYLTSRVAIQGKKFASHIYAG